MEMKDYIFMCLVLTGCCSQAHGACDDATEYTCLGGSCIDLDLVNNTVDDCGDNSDEGYGECVLKVGTPLYHCTDGICYPLTYKLDGEGDCSDNSDEGKIIGTDCSASWCCPCDDFVPNSECSNDLCQCLSGYISNDLGTECNLRIIGDPCNDDPDCYDAVDNSECSSSYCVCSTGYYVNSDNTSCISRKLTEECFAVEECTNVIDYSNCTDNTCQCVHGYYESADNTECISRVVGDSCDVDLDCTPVIDNSFCDVTCTCVDGYTLQTGGKSCGEIIVGDTCSTDTQCDATIDNSVCDSGECACISGYASNEKGSICTERVLGDKCSDDIDCYDAVEYSVCIGKCVCDEGYMDGDDGASCLLRILGDPCQEDADCTLISNSECSESTSTCECLTLFSETPETARCLPFRLDATLCIDDDTCTLHEDKSQCNTAGVCECLGGYYTSSDDVTCVPYVMGSLCTYSSHQCEVAVVNSQCIDDVCTCKPTFYEEEPTTCSPRIVGSPCTRSSECEEAIDGGICDVDNSICTCTLGSKVVDDVDMNVCVDREIGDTCNQDNDCQIGGAACTSEVCACHAGYWQNSTITCVKNRIGDKCSSDSNCALIENSRCSSGECVCDTFYESHNFQQECKELPMYKYPCDVNDDCAKFDHAVCEENICHCLPGFVPDVKDNTCEQFVVGVTACTDSSMCQIYVGRTMCFRSLCVCQEGHAPDVNKTACEQRNILVNYETVGCVSDSQCSQINVNTVCVDQSCQTKPGYQQNIDEDLTLKTTVDSSENPNYEGEKIDDLSSQGIVIVRYKSVFCIGNSDCAGVANAMCVEFECACQTGYHVSYDVSPTNGVQCVATTTNSSISCDVDTDCVSVPHATCVDNVCQRPLGVYSVPGGISKLLLILGDNCTRGDDCYASVEGANCISGFCQCDVGHTLSENLTACGLAAEESSSDCDTFHCEHPWAVGLLITFGVLVSGLISAAVYKLFKKYQKTGTGTVEKSPPGDDEVRPATTETERTVMSPDNAVSTSTAPEMGVGAGGAAIGAGAATGAAASGTAPGSTAMADNKYAPDAGVERPLTREATLMGNPDGLVLQDQSVLGPRVNTNLSVIDM